MQLPLRSRPGLVALVLILMQGLILAQAPSQPTGFRINGQGGSTGNPIAAARLPGNTAAVPNPMWASAGATIVTGRPQCGSTLPASSTVAQINTAISNCAAAHPLPDTGGMVVLGAGTFTVNAAILNRSNVTLRGQGMSTILNVTSTNGSNWQWHDAAITMVGGWTASDGAPTTATAPSGTFRSWIGTNGVSGTYTSGATVINLATAPTGLAVGDSLVLWQDNDTTAPNANLWFSLSSGTVWQGSYYGNYGAMEQRALVTAINGNAVTISPGLVHSTGHWKTRLNPRAAWFSQASQQIRSAGIENLHINATGLNGPTNAVLGIAFCHDCWVTGVAIEPLFTGTGSGTAVDYVVKVQDSFRVTIRNNWIAHAHGGGWYTFTTYGVATSASHHLLVENNIFTDNEQAVTLEVGTMGSVFAYNYDRFTGGEGGIEHHEVGASFNLLEGNRVEKTTSDAFHGNTVQETFFRNHFQSRGVDLWSFHRWYNIVGNVMNTVSDSGQGQVYKTIATDAMKYNRWSGYAIRLGYPGQNNDNSTQCNPGCVAMDPIVWQSTMIWGNYSVTGGTHFDSADVPATDPIFPNPVPSNQNLPASLYLSAKPSWFGSKPFPLNGPDVTGGNVSGYAGHANTTPAEDCYNASGGNIANFNPSTCYP
jgi:hypothetical protein